MKLLVQWATKHPQGWVTLDSSEWDALPKKPEPIGGEVVDDEPGWLSNVCVQGMCSGSVDHVAIEQVGDAVRMTLWKDDPEDHEPGQFFARVLTFHPLKPDSRLGGAINTDIESVMYAGVDRFRKLEAVDFADTELRPWSEFVPPPEAVTRHGIWLTDELAAAHRPLAVPPSWREWGEDGDVPSQRALGRYAKAKGTITYYWRGQDYGGSGDDAYSDLTPAIGQNFKLTENSDTLNNVTRDLLQGAEEEISFAFSTAKSVPGEADWPLGDYRAQIDINGLESGDVHCRTRILQVSDTGVIKDTLGTSTLYTTTGTKLFTVSGYNPAIGVESDRYQIRVLGWNEHDHQTRLMTLGVRTADSFADGPWADPVIEGTGTATGKGTASGVAVLEIPGAATVTGKGTAAGSPILEIPGTATATGVGSSSAAAVQIIPGAATATGVGDAAGSAILEIPGAATATGVGIASGAGTVEGVLFGAATATGVGTVSAVAMVEVAGAATATGKGTASGAAVHWYTGLATATGKGIASASAVLEVPGAATATGVGTASAAGIVTGGVAYWGEPCDRTTGGPRRGQWE